MADTDKSLYSLRYNQVTSNLEAFGGGSPQWTNITLNNDGDGLNLLLPNKKIADTVSFDKAIKGQSYNKTADSWVWSKTLTPGAVNVAAPVLSNSQKPDNSYVAAVSEAPDAAQAAKNANPWWLFLSAAGMIVIFCTALALIKLKIINIKVK